jgi:hypothetical protein
MIDKTYIIDIDIIVLTGVDQRHPGQMTTLIEAEVRRALRGSDLWTSTRIVDSETRVAGEVARTVVRSVQGGPGDV